jgi:ElaB/YqjD/DUF883 family membrane-anchored ribosome-binding protein
MRGGDKEKVAMIGAEKYPNFDLSQVPQRVATRKDFSSAGKSGQSISSLNMVVGHLGRLFDNGESLNNNGLMLWNRVKNTASKQTGNPQVDQMLADRDAVTSELGRVFQTSGVVTQEERESFRQRMSEASSADQIKAVSEEWIHLMKSRLDVLKGNWSNSMGGVKEPVAFVQPQTKSVLVKHGFDPDSLEDVGNKSQGGKSGLSPSEQAEFDVLNKKYGGGK